MYQVVKRPFKVPTGLSYNTSSLFLSYCGSEKKEVLKLAIMVVTFTTKINLEKAA